MLSLTTKTLHLTYYSEFNLKCLTEATSIGYSLEFNFFNFS